MDSVPSCRTIRNLQDFVHTLQRKTVEGYPLSLPERNDNFEKN